MPWKKVYYLLDRTSLSLLGNSEMLLRSGLAVHKLHICAATDDLFSAYKLFKAAKYR